MKNILTLIPFDADAQSKLVDWMTDQSISVEPMVNPENNEDYYSLPVDWELTTDSVCAFLFGLNIPGIATYWDGDDGFNYHKSPSMATVEKWLGIGINLVVPKGTNLDLPAACEQHERIEDDGLEHAFFSKSANFESFDEVRSELKATMESLSSIPYVSAEIHTHYKGFVVGLITP